MILEDLDFTDFYKHIEEIFSPYFLKKEVRDIMEFVHVLSEANFKCYIANMKIIAHRKDVEVAVDNKLIADFEWVARSVGEYRVSSKARINLYISRVRTEGNTLVSSTWENDDVLYSIGEMMDRLSIEFIKRKDFSKNNRPDHMRKSSQELSNRVEKYLLSKLQEIHEKGFYECIHEQRTYDIEQILDNLVI